MLTKQTDDRCCIRLISNNKSYSVSNCSYSISKDTSSESRAISGIFTLGRVLTEEDKDMVLVLEMLNEEDGLIYTLKFTDVNILKSRDDGSYIYTAKEYEPQVVSLNQTV